ncbi:outer membrane beta-barrel protein [Pedobacter sandarakinus]|uniref:outer membrane beta-barrel protein n=1 Tax=Pedobacter sandarakinus TaxID=353156 RepID=UPI002245CC50|nr:outer membrane beta-barrel protein [Pedobacter sandarakinus]MCX2573182.1 outer membrane beta-barrel protein [Pedobacter sandarakinus]
MRGLFFFLFTLIGSVLYAQDSPKITANTGVGIISFPGQHSSVLQSSVTFNSGLQLQLKKNWFIQGDANLNSIGYNQLIRENSTEFLFKDANSGLFQLSLSGGYSFKISPSKLSLSLYAGPGFQRFSEPKVTNDIAARVTTQQKIFRNSVFGKAGSRLNYKTNSAFLQHIYLEATYFTSSLQVQQYRLQGFTYCIGTRFSLM